MTEVAGKPYETLARNASHEVGVGSALINLSEPWPGKEREYSRWYEDDHYFSGAMTAPWLFAGRRWIATRDLQKLRYPAAGGAVDPVTAGCFLGTYWIAPGRLGEYLQWTAGTGARLDADQRMYYDRDLVFTAFQDKAGTAYRDDTVPRDVFSLADPAAGLVLEFVDAPDPAAAGELERWLLEEHLPSRVGAEGPVASAMVFRPTEPLPTMRPALIEAMAKAGNGGRRLTVLWFLREDPRECWESWFRREGSLVEASEKGRLTFLAPFIPAKMGTNAYHDQLRELEEG
ncbi:hypothetical protein ACSVHC_07335 [Arthrobacter sp. KNU-44]|uniref:hypothetical protein n=1 Tax=Arthrobacter sp. KNU-44 TaxID=3450744 RepID=UPI003F424700